MKRVAAFTVIELVITLLLSSIVISVIYYTYFLFNGQFNKYRDKKESMSEYFLFQKVLQDDMDKADAITDSADILVLESALQGSVRYEPGENVIVRYAEENIDSFKLRHGEWIKIPVNDSMPLIRVLKMPVSAGGEQVHSIFKKQYSSVQLLNAEERLHEYQY